MARPSTASRAGRRTANCSTSPPRATAFTVSGRSASSPLRSGRREIPSRSSISIRPGWGSGFRTPACSDFPWPAIKSFLHWGRPREISGWWNSV